MAGVITPGTASGSSTSRNVTQAAHGLTAKDVVRLSGSNTYAKAKADTAANAEVVGMVASTSDANNFSLATGGYVSGLSGLTANTFYFLDAVTAGAITATKPTGATEFSVPCFYADTTTSGYFFKMTGSAVAANPGTILQRPVTSSIGTVVTCNTVMVLDNTIPQSTEGTQVTTVTITPKSASSILLLEAILHGAVSGAGDLGVAAFFQDATANALSSGWSIQTPAASVQSAPIVMSWVVNSVSTAATTFKIRAGTTGGTYYVNGDKTGAAFLGGSFGSFLRVTEYA